MRRPVTGAASGGGDTGGGGTSVASNHSIGYYSANSDFFSATVTNGPLTALVTTHGVYTYGGVSFPRSSYRSSNYWVDLLFR